MVEIKKKIILASGSSRRKELMKQMGFKFEVVSAEVDESYPADLSIIKVAQYIALKKADAVRDLAGKETIVITADTVVWKDKRIYGKPQNKGEAKQILWELSGNRHSVSTGVCMFSAEKQVVFHEVSKVYFRELNGHEIDYYVDNYNTLDKAGAYAIQEWIGITGVYKVEGDFFNVVGLPTARVFEELMNF